MAMLDHPNVIKVYEYFVDEESISQIIEPCRGGELQDRIEAVHRKNIAPMYTEAFMADIIKQTLRALAFMHSQKFMHKDLKPQNIMLVDQYQEGTNSASIKVIDFGLAELFQADQQASSKFGGTLLYMAPEVFNLKLNYLSDIWSVGVILYSLLTGTFPFMAQWPPPAGRDQGWWQGETQKLILDPRRAYEPNPKLNDFMKRYPHSQCINFMNYLFEKDDRRRPDASRCLSHPWFGQYSASAPTLSVGVVQCLEAYSIQPELKKALFLLIAHQSTAPALQELRAIFTHFDDKNQGALSNEDLRGVLLRTGVTPNTAERIVNALDRDGSGTVSWTEFIAAALCISVCRKEALVNSAFHILKMDNRDAVYGVNILQLFGKDNEAVWRSQLTNQCALLDQSKPDGPFSSDVFWAYMGRAMDIASGSSYWAVR